MLSRREGLNLSLWQKRLSTEGGQRRVCIVCGQQLLFAVCCSCKDSNQSPDLWYQFASLRIPRCTVGYSYALGILSFPPRLFIIIQPDLGRVTCNIGYSSRAQIAEPPTPTLVHMGHGSSRNICDIPPHGPAWRFRLKISPHPVSNTHLLYRLTALANPAPKNQGSDTVSRGQTSS
jgi:hypothetical protein